MLKTNIAFLILLVGTNIGFPQGFMNLNFESANTNGLSGGLIPTTNAFPDWSAYFGPPGNPTQVNASIVNYDGLSLGGAGVTLVDSNAPSGGTPVALQGDYSAFLQGSSPAAGSTASIGQTGTISSNAQSLVFLASISVSLQVSFNGQMLS